MSESEANKTPANISLSLRWPWLTILTILVLVATYFWETQQAGDYGPFDTTLLMELGANVSGLSATGDYMRLWYSLFLHQSPGHLLQNIVVLFIVGSVLESLIARSWWLLIYLVGGLFSAWASALWHFDYTTQSVFGYTQQIVYVSTGASGAILALAGAELVMAARAYWHQDKTEQHKRLLRSALIVPFMTLIMGTFESGVDNTAHFAGFGFGLLAGMVVAIWQTTHKRLQTAGCALVTVAIVGGITVSGLSYVQDHPQHDELRQTALDLLAKHMQERHHDRRLKSELENLPPVASPTEARGTVVDLSFVGRVVPAQQSGHMHMLKNYDEATIFDYDMNARQVASSFTQAYPKNKIWGCPNEQCQYIGVTDMALLPDQPGKAFFSNLVVGEVSKVDLATGKTDFSVHTGTFPMRLLAYDGKLYVHDMADSRVTELNAENGQIIQIFQLEDVQDSPYFWRHGDTMALSKDNKRIYVLSHTGQVYELDLATHTVHLWEEPVQQEDPQTAIDILRDMPQRIGTDGQGNVWLLHEDGVSYPDGHAPRLHVHYKLSHWPKTRQAKVRDAFIDPDGDQGLILFIVDKYVLASSAQTGQLLRVYPLAFSASSIFVLDVLDNQHFYVAGRKGVQIFDVDKALRVDPVATEYQQVLEKERENQG